MASFTKKAIRDSFVKLLNEKTLSQITIRDIVDDCGVNRIPFITITRTCRNWWKAL